MTVVVAFLCSDGVVVAADSMLTPRVGTAAGPLGVGHHKGREIALLPGDQLCAFSGDPGLAARFSIFASNSAAQISQRTHALDYPLGLTQAVVTNFRTTGLAGDFDLNTVLAFSHGGACHCCLFEGGLIQPRMLDQHHCYAALGSGKLSADPFLRYLSDIFCPGRQPTVREAIFLATWTVKHVIDTNPGGVAEPIRMAVLEANQNAFVARELPDNEVDEHRQAIDGAAEALRTWLSELQSGRAVDVPAPPEPPVPAPQ